MGLYRSDTCDHVEVLSMHPVPEGWRCIHPGRVIPLTIPILYFALVKIQERFIPDREEQLGKPFGAPRREIRPVHLIDDTWMDQCECEIGVVAPGRYVDEPLVAIAQHKFKVAQEEAEKIMADHKALMAKKAEAKAAAKKDGDEANV